MINLASISNQFVYVFLVRCLLFRCSGRFCSDSRQIIPMVNIVMLVLLHTHTSIYLNTLLHIYTYIHTSIHIYIYIYILYRWQIWAVRLMRGEASEFFENLTRRCDALGNFLPHNGKMKLPEKCKKAQGDISPHA